ncbi:alpha/beta hydrolase [Ancylobacter sp. SL191]|uniref:alpha/beta hydrolase n=1 Tax=Ancylobacter sp. SL191 TaxID=2995166 RepID=UPI0022720612|nr:alpha/beta hydrolase [Ancylobacter sp. SL191]WAC26304.1 alpha/beta hydrolase [Ancylobacter sp. SL191]
MKLDRLIVVAALLATTLGLLFTVPASAQTSPRPPWAAAPVTAKPGQPLPSRADTHVYLLRGLFGVFSLGMDSLAQELLEKGYTSQIYGWDEAQKVIDLIKTRSQAGHTGPVVIIGHSLGANAVIDIATTIQANSIPVDLGVTFDATDPGPVPNNVAVFINFWAQDGFGKPVSAVPGYTGQLENFDLSGQPNISHTSIDTMDKFHQFVISTLEGMTGN